MPEKNTKQFYFAPLEGIATYHFRNAYRKYFTMTDKFFSPFIVTKPAGALKKKEIRDVVPERNVGINLVPQLLSNHPQGFVNAAGQLQEMGYEEINLNLGCPSGTVVSKGRGAGFLREPEELDRFLDYIFERVCVRISVKTRIGFAEPEEFFRLLSIYNQYPICELIIHPRTRSDFYKNKPHLDMFSEAVRSSKHVLCYNGDIVTTADYHALQEQFGMVDRWMIGRGLLRNPGLLSDIRGGEEMTKDNLLAFHDELYGEYRSLFDGERNVLFKMKELWLYLADVFVDSGRYLKKIRKCQRLAEYELSVRQLFAEREISEVR